MGGKMPARDFYHDVVKAALIADGWTITHDPLQLKIGKKDLFVDLGAEQLLAADKAGRKIAVEVKSFFGDSEVDDLEKALGQFILYHGILGRKEPERRLYLAIRREVYEDLFTEPIGQLLLELERLKLLVFDPERGAIVRWIPD
jgi:hypothetical protein